MTTAYAAIAATVIAASVLSTTIYLIRAHRRAKALPPITEAQAREHSRPLSHAIMALAPINPPNHNPTEER